MKQLWAPWRVEYIAGDKPEKCIFCKHGDSDLILYDGEISTVLLNKYPYNSGHILIAPKRHSANLESLTEEESASLTKLIKESVVILKKTFNPDGLNIGMNLGKAAGAGIEDHLHWHIVPRWNGDTNFMPVVSEIRVMPEHLLKILEKLKPLFEKIAK